jgi:hypothetical protein
VSTGIGQNIAQERQEENVTSEQNNTFPPG